MQPLSSIAESLPVWYDLDAGWLSELDIISAKGDFGSLDLTRLQGSEEPSQGLIGIVGIGPRAKVNVDYTGMFGERVLARIAKVAIAGDQDPIHLAGSGIVEGISLAELIRRTIDRYLAELPVEEDPALRVIGLGRSGRSDMASKHDDYLAALAREENL